MIRQNRRVNVTSDTPLSLEIVLEPSASVLDEVIVTGTVVATERKAIPTPITIVTAADLERRGITHLEQLFRGEIPGVIALEIGSQAYANSGYLSDNGASSQSRVYARGVSNLDGAANPLKIYIDGIELLEASYLGTIDPGNIDRIEIITGPQAATIYGSGATGGVMQIFTKKGSGSTAIDVRVNLQYGLIENNLTSGRAPSHRDGIQVTGGSGDITYASNLSYTYTGQWQPRLWNRSYGASAGVRQVRERFSADGSVGVTARQNGVTSGCQGCLNGGPVWEALQRSGEWRGTSGASPYTQKAANLMAGVTLEYRPLSVWRHQLTMGGNWSAFDLVPVAPRYDRPSDSLHLHRGNTGRRASGSYNSTMVWREGPVAVSATLGVTTSTGTQVSFEGYSPSLQMISLGSTNVAKTLDARSWGGFTSWQIGVLERLYITLGLRGERSPAYGDLYKTDWTPTNGVAYTMEFAEMSLKVLGSYGSASRPPGPSMKLEEKANSPVFDPSSYISQRAALYLTPEYERGPQGGIEVYFGNRWSATVNAYRQTVKDLIQRVAVDSTELLLLSPGITLWYPVFQYLNAGNVRKYGVETTAGVNLGFLSLKGTYSWNESRVLSISPLYPNPHQYPIGGGFAGVPTHSGNLVLGYARAGTSVTLVTNVIGASMQTGASAISPVLWLEQEYARIRTYIASILNKNMQVTRPGYSKANLNASQRISSGTTVTLGIANIGNAFGRDGRIMDAVMGRQMNLGVSYQFPRR